MKEPKQSSPALSNAPGTPHPDPPTASPRGRRGAQLSLRDHGVPGPVCLLPGASGAADPLPEARRAVRPGRGRVWRGEGGVRPQWPRTSRSGNPLPHSLSLQLCRGLANGKRKLGQRKRRQTPRLKNPDKRRGPPTPAARPRGAWHRRPGRCPLPWQPRTRPGPLPAFRLPDPCPGHFSLRPPPTARHQPRFPAAVPVVPAACAPGRARRAGAPRPLPCGASSPAAPGSSPFPWPSDLT